MFFLKGWPCGFSAILFRRFPFIRVFHSSTGRSNPSVEAIRGNYAAAYWNQGTYRQMRGDTVAAFELFRKAFVLKPDFPPALEWSQRQGQTP